ncbi:hypothetical protein U2P60_14725 [Brucella sp. H1_1004]|uniref:hypothetical protein n=1 Tax=Brucella sp. H1_1004 TaxID=3110109 RepID=UPI0039B5E149
MTFLTDVIQVETTQNGNALELRFSRPVTDDDRKSLMDAHNAALNTRPDAPVDGLERFSLAAWSEEPTHHSYIETDPVGEYVRFDQAEAIIAVERAKADEYYGEAVVSYDRKLRVSELEADNAALTARVKEREQQRDEYRDKWKSIMEQEKSSRKTYLLHTKALETQLAAAEEREKKAFKAGYVLACCNVVHQHDEPTIAHDALAELGVTKAEVKAMKLSEFDMKALRIIERDRAISPYAKHNPKARAALEVKP